MISFTLGLLQFPGAPVYCLMKNSLAVVTSVYGKFFKFSKPSFECNA